MMEAIKTIKTALAGLGNVNIGWMKIVLARKEELASKYHIQFLIVAVADSSGVAVNSDGWDINTLISLKQNKGFVRELNGFLPGIKTDTIPDHVNAHLLIESLPGNILDGQPGLNLLRRALIKGWAVVLANKTPLLFGFDELQSLSDQHGGGIAYSATVCGGLPVINVLKRDLKLARLNSLRGIFNATSNFVLQQLERGGNLNEAIKEAQRLGAAEADPSHDIHGHDTANKLFIIMKSFTKFNGTIHDISVQGIENITAAELTASIDRGCKFKLIAEAVAIGEGWQLSVKPVEILSNSFLGSCDGWEMGIEVETDLYEKVYLKNFEADPVGTSAAVLRDAIEVSGFGFRVSEGPIWNKIAQSSREPQNRKMINVKGLSSLWTRINWLLGR